MLTSTDQINKFSDRYLVKLITSLGQFKIDPFNNPQKLKTNHMAIKKEKAWPLISCSAKSEIHENIFATCQTSYSNLQEQR